MASEDLSLLSLFPATKEQTLESRKRTFVQWGRGLSIDQYLARDSQLDVAEHARDGQLTTWVLAPRDDPTTLDFMCSCETFRRKSLMKRSDSGTPEVVVGYGVASVFTPVKNRGKRYARRMMNLLHWVLAPHAVLPSFPPSWGIPPPERPGYNNAQFSALYSDVGPTFYASAGPSKDTEGWIVRDPVSTTWNVSKDAEEATSLGTDTSIRWLDEKDCKDILEHDAALMCESVSSDSKSVAFTFLPTNGIGLFQVLRTVFFTPGQSYSVPTKWGVEIRNENLTESDLAFATWTLDIRPPPATLIATRIRATKETFPAILSCMSSAARENAMERIEFWNLPKELAEVAEQIGGRTDERDEHLNAFKWYGPEKNDDIYWAYNEKYCWC